MEIIAKKNRKEELTREEEDHLNQFTGNDFPTESELGQLEKLLKHIIQTYRIIDPQD